MKNETPDLVYGRVNEAVYFGSHAFERSFIHLKWLLQEDRWKQCGRGFSDISLFLKSLQSPEFNYLTEHRKQIADMIRGLQPKASNRAIAHVVGADEGTIRKSRRAENSAPPRKNASNINAKNTTGAEFSAPPASVGGAAAAQAVAALGARQERKDRKEAAKVAVATAAFSADGPFGTVVIDPPWEVEKIDRDVRPNQDVFDYPTLSQDALIGLWHRELAPRILSDCHLFIWTTHKHLPNALAFIAAAGFRYCFTMVWHKSGGFQPVGLAQFNCEFVIYARRGSPLFVDTKDFPCCFDGERREHSRKPDRFYDIVRRVTGGSRLDAFAREPRAGFAQFGNETGKFSNAAEAAE